MRLPRTATLRSWIGPAMVAIATLYIVMLLTLASWAFVPVLFGWSPMAISSGSMRPHVEVGDVVVVAPYDGRDLNPGTIATYHEAGRLVTHRILEVTDGGYITKGDANPEPDSTVLTADNIVGTGRVLAPYIARPHMWAASGQILELIAFAAVTFLALTITLARPGIQLVPDGLDGDGDDLGPEPVPDPPPAGAVPPADVPAASPAFAGGVGMVWHASALPGRQPTLARRRHGRGVLTVTLTTLALTTVALTTVATTAGAVLSDTTSAGHSWSGHLAPATGIEATAGCTDGKPWVQVNWHEHDRADGYQLGRDSGGGWQTHTVLNDPTATAVRDSDVAVDGTYAYRVVATASSWLADPSSTVTVDTTGVCDS